MSATTSPECSDELELSARKQKKGSLSSGHELGEGLRALLKTQEAAGWRLSPKGMMPAPASN